MTSKLDLLKNIYDNYNINRDDVIIDLLFIIKYLEAGEKRPKNFINLINKNYSQEFIQKNKDYLDSYIYKRYKFNHLVEKYKRSGIPSLFKLNSYFFKVFLENNPTPQNVNLPFYDWDSDILYHYLNIAFNSKIAYYAVENAVASLPPRQGIELPFLSCIKEYMFKDYNIFLWYIPLLSLDKKDDHYIPLRFDCIGDTGTNVEQLNASDKFYSVKNPYYDRFALLEKSIPHHLPHSKSIHLIITSRKIKQCFKTSFLRMEHMPDSIFLFTSYKNLNNIAEAYPEMQYFYTSFKPVYHEIRKYLKKRPSYRAKIIHNIKRIMRKFSLTV